MIQLLTKVKIIDNSGGAVGRCIKILKPHGRDYAKIGDVILVSVINTTKQLKESRIKKGTMFKALVVQTKVNNILNTASFDENSVILLKNNNAHKKVQLSELAPVGTRLKGPISILLNSTNKVATLSPISI